MPRFSHLRSTAAALAAFALGASCRDEPAPAAGAGANSVRAAAAAAASPTPATPSSTRPTSLPATFEARAVSTASVHGALEPVIAGPLSREEIRAVVNRNVAQLMICFQLAPADAPQSSGKLTIHFTIDPGGHVVDATVAQSTVGKSPVATCVLETVQSLEFPKPRGGGTVDVSYPFVFRPAR